MMRERSGLQQAICNMSTKKSLPVQGTIQQLACLPTVPAIPLGLKSVGKAIYVAKLREINANKDSGWCRCDWRVARWNLRVRAAIL